MFISGDRFAGKRALEKEVRIVLLLATCGKSGSPRLKTVVARCVVLLTHLLPQLGQSIFLQDCLGCDCDTSKVKHGLDVPPFLVVTALHSCIMLVARVYGL